MNKQEQWLMWEPLSKLDGDFYREAVIDGYHGGYKIIVADHNDKEKKIHITFKIGVSSYRKIYETYAWVMQKDFLRDGSYFYKVTNSKYIQWLSDISESVSSDMEPNMQHFVVFT